MSLPEGFDRMLSIHRVVQASEIPQGQCFRKRTGSYVYLRISPASLKFWGLNDEDVFGVCFNGNMCSLAGHTMVVQMPPIAMADNRIEDEDASAVFNDGMILGEVDE